MGESASWTADHPERPANFEMFRRNMEKAKQAALSVTETRDDTGGDVRFVYLTCLPTMAFASVVHPVSGPDDFIPRVAWGKAERCGCG